MQNIGPNHYTGTIVLPEAGDWNLVITVDLATGQSVVMNALATIPG